MSSLSAQITTTGITAPDYPTILASLQAQFQAIYGSDIYIAPDSQDGQFLALIASAIHDNNQALIAVFQSFSPTYSQGVGLSSIVKINGLQRLVPTNSTAVGNVVGQAGSVIINGVVKDTNGNKWNLPTSVTIPVGGSVSVTVTAQQPGSIQASIGAIDSIDTIQLGWQSFVNTVAATQGSPVESDAELRIRQSVSTALPGLSNLESIIAAIGNVLGVTRYRVYENDSDVTDSNGIPDHSIAPVVEGGSVSDIANAIRIKKPPGTKTFGDTSYTIYDSAGLPTTINFHALTSVPIYVAVGITALPGYLGTTGALIIESVSAAINNLAIGEDVYISRMYSPANLSGESAQEATGLSQVELYALSETYHITSLTVGLSVGTLAGIDVPIAYNSAASGNSANVSLTVT